MSTLRTVTSQPVYQTSHDLNNQRRLDVAFDVSGKGCRAGIYFCSVTHGITGQYIVKLKNINGAQNPVASNSANDGFLTFDYNLISFVKAQVSTAYPLVVGDVGFCTFVYVDIPNNQIIIWVAKSTGLVDLTADDRLNLSVVFETFRRRN